MNKIEGRIEHLKSELRRVNDEMTYFFRFTVSTDPTIQRLQKYKNYIRNEIRKLAESR